jgi:putative transposase
MIIEKWRVHYNTRRPHSALGYRPLTPFTLVQPTPPLDAVSNMN